MAAAALGGAVGAVCRWGLGEAFPAPGDFPVTTFAINVAGALLLGLVPVLARGSDVVRVALGPGLLGGFTTMSAAAEDTRALLDAGHVLTALAYCGGTAVAAVAAAWVGSALLTPRLRAQEPDS